MARGRKCHVRWAATQGELVFGQAVFLSSPRPPPLPCFAKPDPDLAARIQDSDLITNSVFFDHPKPPACRLLRRPWISGRRTTTATATAAMRACLVHFFAVFYLRNRKHVPCFYQISSYTNTSGSLGEREMLWGHEPQASVSTAFSTSPKLLRVFV